MPFLLAWEDKDQEHPNACLTNMCRALPTLPLSQSHCAAGLKFHFFGPQVHVGSLNLKNVQTLCTAPSTVLVQVLILFVLEHVSSDLFHHLTF